MFREGPRVLGQLGNTYIVCEVKDGFMLVDQHAAHERVVYEGLREGYSASRVEVQEFLVPYNLELSGKEAGVVAKRADQFQRLGIQLEHFGGNTFLMRSAPALLGNAEWDTLIADLVGEMESGPVDDQAVLDKALTVMACHGAIRAGKRMSVDEMGELLEQLNRMNLPTNCPHGRPIFKHFTYGELERMFKRVV
jgi:DNA mismatch repair protein MutL